MPRFAWDNYESIGWTNTPLQQQDEVASRARWHPCAVGFTAAEDLRQWEDISADRVERRSKLDNLPGLGCALGLFLFLALAGVSALFEPTRNFANRLFLSCFGLTIAVPSALVALHLLFRQIPAKLNRQYFDWGQGFSVNRDCHISQPAQIDRSVPPPRNIRRGQVDEISAIQILRKYYIKRGLEVNLVLESGARINIVKSERGHYAMTQAKKLADFLDVAIWNESSRGAWEFRSKMTIQTQRSGEAVAMNIGALLATIWFSITRQYDRIGHWEWVPSGSAHAPVSQA